MTGQVYLGPGRCLADWQTGAPLSIPGHPEPAPPHDTHCTAFLVSTSLLSFAYNVRSSLCPVSLPSVAARCCASVSSGAVFPCCSFLLLFKERREKREREVTGIGMGGEVGRSRQTQTGRWKVTRRAWCSVHCGHVHTHMHIHTCTHTPYTHILSRPQEYPVRE